MPETLLKRDSSTGISLKVFVFFRRTLFTEHLRMTVPADCLVSTKVLFSDYTSFFPSFHPFISDNCNYGTSFREGIKMKILYHF